jgi:hypothetical protein
VKNCNGQCLSCEKRVWCNTYQANKYDIDENTNLYEIKVNRSGNIEEPKWY